MQCARNGGRRHRQHIHLVAQLLEQLLVRHAEALLLVHHQQAEIEEDHIFAEQAMCTYHNIDLAQRQVLQYLLLLFLRAEAAQ